MKQFIAVSLLIMAFGVFADDSYDSYLLWMVGDEGVSSITMDGVAFNFVEGKTYTAGVYSFDNQSSTRSDTYLALFDTPGDASFGSSVELDGAYGSAAVYAGIPAIHGDSISYFIELLQDGQVIGQSSESLSYSALGEYLSHGSDMTPAKTWQVSTFVSAGIVPEPNSAMLMLFGFAALALRRRRLAKRV